jgi:Zn-dependent protease with chaperone function
MVAWIAPAAVSAAQRMRARRGAEFLLVLRLLPPMAALILVAAICVPSYLLLEQDAGAEEVGLNCLGAAVLAASLWSVSIARSVRATMRSLRHARDWQQGASRSILPGARQPVWIVDGPAPLLALAGVLRPQVVISRVAAETLSTGQLRAALRHEEAHRAAYDNLKRLLLLLSPGLLPGWNGFQLLERGWFRLTEWAADDDAVGGKPRLSLSLAAALVRMARMGVIRVQEPLAFAFLADGKDLSTRVDRLLQPAVAAPASSRRPLIVVTAVLAVVVAAATFQPATLASAHWLLEYLIR